MPDPTVVVTHRGEDRFRAGHPWVYRGDLVDAPATGGQIVRVCGPRGREIGYALYSDRSQIALRFWSHEPGGTSLLPRRIEAALAYRARLAIDATAYRLVHGEADRLPSLVVDCYGDYLVVQALSQTMDRLQPLIAETLQAAVAPAGILARNDPRARELEGLPRETHVLLGRPPDRVPVREGPLVYEADLWHGQKTGLFLDQRENREAARQYAGGRLLDGFAYHGGFGLRLADRCESVLAIEISADAVDQLARNAARNGLVNVQARVGNAFDLLRELADAGERFDTIVLDPPAFAKNRAAIPKALTGYKEINLRAFRLLNPGGYLISCTCSYHLDETMFGDVLRAAARDAHCEVAVVERRMQSRDHPVLLAVPETHYLKCFILRRLPP